MKNLNNKEMKASELRIGNFIADYEAEPNKTIYWQVETIEHLNNTLGVRFRNGSCWTCEEIIEPIPLTEEWLLKFGAYKQDNIFCFEKSFISIEKVDYEDSYVVVLYDSYNDISVSISLVKYVHELQNLYFALTGEELTLKEL